MLSSHFSWDEVIFSPTAAAKGIDNRLPDSLKANAILQSGLMEQVRLLIGGPIQVTSWYRCLELNTAIGGSVTSYHMQALATDWKPLAMRLDDAFGMVARSGIKFDQLIHEQTASGSRWIHIGSPKPGAEPRLEILRARGAALGGRMNFTRVSTG